MPYGVCSFFSLPQGNISHFCKSKIYRIEDISHFGTKYIATPKRIYLCYIIIYSAKPAPSLNCPKYTSKIAKNISICHLPNYKNFQKIERQTFTSTSLSEILVIVLVCYLFFKDLNFTSIPYIFSFLFVVLLLT